MFVLRSVFSWIVQVGAAELPKFLESVGVLILTVSAVPCSPSPFYIFFFLFGLGSSLQNLSAHGALGSPAVLMPRTELAKSFHSTLHTWRLGCGMQVLKQGSSSWKGLCLSRKLLIGVLGAIPYSVGCLLSLCYHGNKASSAAVQQGAVLTEAFQRLLCSSLWF